MIKKSQQSPLKKKELPPETLQEILSLTMFGIDLDHLERTPFGTLHAINHFLSLGWGLRKEFIIYLQKHFELYFKTQRTLDQCFGVQAKSGRGNPKIHKSLKVKHEDGIKLVQLSSSIVVSMIIVKEAYYKIVGLKKSFEAIVEEIRSEFAKHEEKSLDKAFKKNLEKAVVTVDIPTDTLRKKYKSTKGKSKALKLVEYHNKGWIRVTKDAVSL